MTDKIPPNSQLIKNIQRDTDPRGQILSIVEHPIKNVSIIESHPNTHRSNHYHFKDFHFMYVLNGEIDYFYKPIDSDDVSYFKIKEGETILTPPMEVHSCFFPVSTLLVVSSGFPRDPETYEADTVRLDFINSANVQDMIKKYGKK